MAMARITPPAKAVRREVPQEDREEIGKRDRKIIKVMVERRMQAMRQNHRKKSFSWD